MRLRRGDPEAWRDSRFPSTTRHGLFAVASGVNHPSFAASSSLVFSRSHAMGTRDAPLLQGSGATTQEGFLFLSSPLWEGYAGFTMLERRLGSRAGPRT